jgi:hypothetical protein
MTALGPFRKWCHRDTTSELHRLVDVGLLATVMKKVKPPNAKALGPTQDVLVVGQQVKRFCLWEAASN